MVIRKSGRWVFFFAHSFPSQPGSLPALFPYPSFRPSMGRGTRPPRSKAEVMLSNWSSPGSQSPPKAVRKRLAGVEGRTSSTSWLRTRKSAWYGSRGPEEAKSATQLHPTLCSVPRVFPKPPSSFPTFPTPPLPQQPIYNTGLPFPSPNTAANDCLHVTGSSVSYTAKDRLQSRTPSLELSTPRRP